MSDDKTKILPLEDVSAWNLHASLERRTSLVDEVMGWGANRRVCVNPGFAPTSCMTLSKLHSLSVPSFLICHKGTIPVS